MDKLNKAIVSFIGISLLAAGGFVIKGWVLSAVWQWFVVPIGLPVIGIAHAIGISLTYSAIHGISHAELYAIRQMKDKESTASRMLTSSYVAPMIVYAFAWIAHSFM